MTKVKKKHCAKCGNEWTSRKDDPLECPRCKSRNWSKAKKVRDVK